jgi:hypothetical protein
MRDNEKVQHPYTYSTGLSGTKYFNIAQQFSVTFQGMF